MYRIRKTVLELTNKRMRVNVLVKFLASMLCSSKPTSLTRILGLPNEHNQFFFIMLGFT